MREVKIVTYNVHCGKDTWREFGNLEYALQFAKKLISRGCQEEIKIIQHTKTLTEEDKVVKIIK